MIRVLVADDERLARQAITLPLQRLPDIGEVLEASNGNEALLLAEQYQPDVVFLDIQMPGLSGLQVAKCLDDHFAVVFVTAYQEYAITAFELNAIDYLLKPFNEDRLFCSLDKALHKVHEVKQGLEPLMGGSASHSDSSQYKNRLAIKEPGRIRLIDVEDINYIIGAGNYAEVHLMDGRAILHRETMTSLEHQLDPAVFVRIHRSSIVRYGNIVELRPNENGDYSILLKQGQTLTLSRRNKHKLAFLLGEQ